MSKVTGPLLSTYGMSCLRVTCQMVECHALCDTCHGAREVCNMSCEGFKVGVMGQLHRFSHNNSYWLYFMAICNISWDMWYFSWVHAPWHGSLGILVMVHASLVVHQMSHVTAHISLVSGQMSFVKGHVSLVMGRLPRVKGHVSLVQGQLSRVMCQAQCI